MDDNDNGRIRPAEITDDDEREAKRLRLDKAAMLTPTTIFDSKGDLYLVVGSDVRVGDPSTFLVCSRARARASPVFDKMLFGPFAESRPTAETSKQGPAWVVHLPEDEPAHLEMVLNILHSNFKNIPPKFPSPLLSGMVTVAEKYDCIESFRPWVNSCIPGLDPDDKHDPKFSLHVAWQLGSIYNFKKALSMIVDASFISEGGQISIIPRATPNSGEGKAASVKEPQDLNKYLGDLVPAEVVEQIKRHRIKLIDAAMDPFVTLYGVLSTAQRRCIWSYQYAEKCDSILLGSLIRAFSKTAMGSPTRDAIQRYCGTFVDLQKSLDSVQLLKSDQCRSSSACCRDIEEKRRQSCQYQDFEKRSEAIVLSPEQKERLDRQAIKSGLL